MTQKQNRKLLFLFAHLHKGGMQKLAANLSSALPEEFMQYVVFFGTENPDFGYHAEMVHLHAEGSMQSGPVRKLLNFVRRLRRLQKFIDTHQIDIVVSFGDAANILNCLTKRKRAILTAHASLKEGIGQTGRYGPIYQKLIRLLYHRAERLVPCSQAIAGQFRAQMQLPAEKLTVIEPFYDSNLLRKATESLPTEWEPVFAKPTVINVGSLIYQKGHEYLLRAFQHAYRVRPELQLVLVGSGELLTDLQAQAHELGIEGNVHFTGFDSNPYRYMARASAFVLTSRFEGFPAVLIEAMVCGLPVIATDCNTGPREILGESEFGLLLPDIKQENQLQVECKLGEAILQMLEPEEAARYRKQSLQRSEQYSPERTIGKWLKVLMAQEVMAQEVWIGQGEVNDAKTPSGH